MYSEERRPNYVYINGQTYPVGRPNCTVHERYDDDNYPYPHEYDVAVCKLAGDADPEFIDPELYPMTLANSVVGPGDTYTIVGCSETGQNQGDLARRSGTQIVDVVFSTGFVTEQATSLVDPVPIGGDSGGPSLVVEGGVEKIIGVTTDFRARNGTVASPAGPTAIREWINTTCNGCIANWTPPPPGFVWNDTESVWCAALSVDSDGDGVADWADNCPTVANADQDNCQGLNDWLIHGQIMGDACDPSPCYYVAGVSEKVSQTGSGTIIKSVGPADVYYRGVGYTDTSDHRWEDLDARYCGCQNAARTDIYAEDYLTDKDCRLQCPQNGDDAVVDSITDVGWQRVLWSAYQDTLTTPYTTGLQSCPAVDNDPSDGVTVQNECDLPVPQRLAVHLYYANGTSTGLGNRPMDSERFWTHHGAHMTRKFTWAWQHQDYPHPAAIPYIPPDDPRAPTSVLKSFRSKSFLWFRPAIASLEKRADHYSSTALEMGYVFSPRLPWAAVFPRICYLVPEMVMVPAYAGWMGDLPADVPVLQTFAAGRPTVDIAEFLWESPPPNAATIGLAVKRLRPTNEDLGDAVPSRMSVGPALTTTEFAVAQLGESDLYVFGGRMLDGTRPARLWHGQPATDEQGQRIYLWEMLAEGGPAGRTGAVLVPDGDRGRLVLMLGDSGAGTLQDAWAFDLDSRSWSQETLQVTGLTARSHVGYAVNGDNVYIYGGRQGDSPLEGLYEVNLVTLEGTRIDDAGSGPGSRSAAALAHMGRMGDVVLFGGRSGEGLLGDLWRFDVARHTWSLLAASGGEGAPPAMENTSLAVCRITGAVTVLAGQPDASPAEPLWRHRWGQWESFSQVTGGEQ